MRALVLLAVLLAPASAHAATSIVSPADPAEYAGRARSDS